MLIGSNWKIEADSLNVTLHKRYRHRGTGADYWKVEGYYGTILNALEALTDLGVADTALKDLETVSRKQDELHGLIRGLALSPQ